MIADEITGALALAVLRHEGLTRILNFWRSADEFAEWLETEEGSSAVTLAQRLAEAPATPEARRELEPELNRLCELMQGPADAVIFTLVDFATDLDVVRRLQALEAKVYGPKMD